MAATGARGGNKMPPIWSAGLAYFFTAGINFFLIQLLESADSALKDRLLIVGGGVRIVIFRFFVEVSCLFYANPRPINMLPTVTLLHITVTCCVTAVGGASPCAIPWGIQLHESLELDDSSILCNPLELRDSSRKESPCAGGVKGGAVTQKMVFVYVRNSEFSLLKVCHDHHICKRRIFSRSPRGWSYKACTTNGKQSKVKTSNKVESSKFRSFRKICSVLLLGLCSGTRIIDLLGAGPRAKFFRTSGWSRNPIHLGVPRVWHVPDLMQYLSSKWRCDNFVKRLKPINRLLGAGTKKCPSHAHRLFECCLVHTRLHVSWRLDGLNFNATLRHRCGVGATSVGLSASMHMQSSHGFVNF